MGDLWVQHHVRSGKIRVSKISGLENPSDAQTKYLGPEPLPRHTNACNWVPLDAGLWLTQKSDKMAHFADNKMWVGNERLAVVGEVFSCSWFNRPAGRKIRARVLLLLTVLNDGTELRVPYMGLGAESPWTFVLPSKRTTHFPLHSRRSEFGVRERWSGTQVCAAPGCLQAARVAHWYGGRSRKSPCASSLRDHADAGSNRWNSAYLPGHTMRSPTGPHHRVGWSRRGEHHWDIVWWYFLSFPVVSISARILAVIFGRTPGTTSDPCFLRFRVSCGLHGEVPALPTLKTCTRRQLRPCRLIPFAEVHRMRNFLAHTTSAYLGRQSFFQKYVDHWNLPPGAIQRQQALVPAWLGDQWRDHRQSALFTVHSGARRTSGP